MKVKHILDREKRFKNTNKDNTFLLSNKGGDYLWLSETPKSRYQGWFVSPNEESCFRIIENIFPLEGGEVKEIQNYFSKVVRKRDNVIEEFVIDRSEHRFCYKLEEEREIELTLDARDSYSDSYSEYNIELKDKKLIITADTEKGDIFLVISGFTEFEKKEERFVRDYNFDKERNSPPFEKAVFKALNIIGKELIFAASQDKMEAMELVEKCNPKKIEKTNEPLDFVAAKEGLKGLVTSSGRIFAGYPWFFQFWKRDEAISLKGLKVIDSSRAKELFWSLLKKRKGVKGVDSADAIGWVFKRAFLFLNDFTNEEEERLSKCLKNNIDFDKKEPLIVSEEKETWMDSIKRRGARIEIQALQLNMYKLGRLIDEDRADVYKKMEEKLKERVRNIFWDGEVLADGYDIIAGKKDKTVRPNIFLAYYIYPELLTEEEWVKCFRKALYELWLDWGGLATVSKNSPMFHIEHTGEAARSYHQGDSWYFVNNLAAIAMNRLDSGKFSYEINKILQASRRDLMWLGAVGHHSELSSANRQTSEGAISQAWSFASYLEAMYEVFKIKNYSWS